VQETVVACSLRGYFSPDGRPGQGLQNFARPGADLRFGVGKQIALSDQVLQAESQLVYPQPARHLIHVRLHRKGAVRGTRGAV